MNNLSGNGSYRTQLQASASKLRRQANDKKTEDNPFQRTGSAQAAKKVQEKTVDKKELPDCFGIPINDRFVKKFFQVA